MWNIYVNKTKQWIYCEVNDVKQIGECNWTSGQTKEYNF